LQPFSIDTNSVVFLHTGSSGNVTTGYACYPVLIVHNSQIASFTPARVHGTPMSQRRAHLEANPARAAGLARARARLGKWMDAEPELQSTSKLSALRLKAGLSQAQLATALGTSQPNVARMEKGTGNYTLEVMRDWSNALGVSLIELIEAIDAVKPAQTLPAIARAD